MNYIEIGKIPPNSKNELSTPEQLIFEGIYRYIYSNIWS